MALSSQNPRLAAPSLLVAGCAVALAIGCGGTDEQPRPEPPEFLAVPDSTDTGSGPYDCGSDDDYEFVILEDWESGAGAGWYTNNEYCQDLNDLQTANDELSRFRDCLEGAKDGCTPEETLEALGLTGESAQDVADQLSADIDANMDLQSLTRDQCMLSQIPVFGSKPLPAVLLEPNRCGSFYALSLRTIKTKRDAGTLGVNFAQPFDARDFDGVSFWARRSFDSPGLLKIGVAEKHTDEKFLDEDGQPPCLFETTSAERETLACDKFTGTAQLGTDWRFFKIPFDGMRQGGFGKPAPFLDRGALSGVAIGYGAGTWDIWIDDIGFYKRP